MQARSAAAAWIVLVVALLDARPVSAYTPDDPVVQAMVERGISYLENARIDAGTPGSQQAGEVMLVAYAHHKVRHDPEHPLVQRGLAAADEVVEALKVADAGGEGVGHIEKINYVVCVAVLLFAEVDPDRYEADLIVCQRFIFRRQRDFGGFTYTHDSLGDTSQSQYAVLAIWTLDRSGVPLDYKRVADIANWYMRVQDVGGGWPYMGSDPGNGPPRRQQKVTMSTSLAGASSILIAGDALRVWGETSDSDNGVPGLPKQFKLFKEDGNKKERRRVKLSAGPLLQSVDRFTNYREQNPFVLTPQTRLWWYYQIYTLERYESFLEIARGDDKDLSPAWYNEVVDQLRERQKENGGWVEVALTRPHVNTAFALLFLIRSTQRSIFSANAGSLAGGRDLPADTTQIRIEGTQIKGRPIAAQVTDLLAILESDGADATAGQSLPEDMQLATDPDTRRAQLDRFERLVRGSQSWQARRVAARLLGKSDELRVAPALIYALSDADDSVRRYARDGLRFISRRFDGFGLSDKPDEADIEAVQEQWRDWYRSIYPTYTFID